MLFATGASEQLFSEFFLNVIVPSFWDRFVALVAAPFRLHDMLWIVIPLLVTLLMMEFYFGRYRREELGWNTAVGNSLVLVFVSIDLLRRIYGTSTLAAFDTFSLNVGKTVMAFVVGFGGLFIFYYDFFHLFPKSFAFKISSPLTINLVAYLSIVVIYTGMGLDLYTFAAAATLFLCLSGFFAIVQLVEPKVKTRTHSGLDRILGNVLRPLEMDGKKKTNKHRK